jgi:hypothetical protein
MRERYTPGRPALSGLDDRCASREDDCNVYPKRHGCSGVNPFSFRGLALHWSRSMCARVVERLGEGSVGYASAIEYKQ